MTPSQLITATLFSSLLACSSSSDKNTDSGNTSNTDTDNGSSTNPEDYPEPTFGLTTESITVDNLNRTYDIYVPQSYTAESASPVMINFHGGTGTSQSQMWISDMRDLAEAENFILIYPQGSELENGDTHWNPLMSSELNKSDTDDFAFVSAMLDEVAANYRIDADRVYATGYSNGAGISYGLACYLSDRVAAVAPVSGSMYMEMDGSCTINHPTAIAIFNGTQDYERPWEGMSPWFYSVDDATAWWNAQNGITGSAQEDSFNTGGMTVERQVFTGGNGGVEVARYKFVGGGHDWFDMSIDGANLDETIWNFVSRFDKNGRR